MTLEDAPAPEHLAAYARAPDDALAQFLEAAVERARAAGEAAALRVSASHTFGLACPCGEPAMLVGVAYNWDVVDLACGGCGREAALYDPTRHGRLGSRGRNDYARPPFEAVPYGCMCRMMLFEPAVLLGYEADAEGAQDFSWLVAGGRCAACGVHNLIHDAACA